MKWNKVNFGTNKKVQNKTLPQIMFIDPDWFFFQYERDNSYLKKAFGIQADTIYQRSRNIKPREGHYIKHFLFCDNTSDGFTPISIEKAEQKFSECIESSITCQDLDFLDTQKFFIFKRIDLRFPKTLKQYDKKSCKFFVDELKEYLSLGKRITEQKAIDFFENDENFILEK